MIKVHYHTFKKKPRSHVYSDIGDIEELKRWAKEHHVSRDWIQTKGIPHYDLFGIMLDLTLATQSVTHEEFRKDYKNIQEILNKKKEEKWQNKETGLS